MLFQTHKKGFIAGVLTFMMSFLAIVFIILVFYFLLRFKADSVKHTFGSSKEINELSLSPLLLNYLRSTRTLDGKHYTIADLIVMYSLGYLEAEELQKINKEYIDRLNEIYEDKEIYLIIYDEKNKVDKSVSIMGSTLISVSEEVLIPTPDGKNVKVALVIPEERTYDIKAP